MYYRKTEDTPAMPLTWTWQFRIIPFSAVCEQHYNLIVMSSKNNNCYLIPVYNIEIMCLCPEELALPHGEKVPH